MFWLARACPALAEAGFCASCAPALAAASAFCPCAGSWSWRRASWAWLSEATADCALGACLAPEAAFCSSFVSAWRWAGSSPAWPCPSCWAICWTWLAAWSCAAVSIRCWRSACTAGFGSSASASATSPAPAATASTLTGGESGPRSARSAPLANAAASSRCRVYSQPPSAANCIAVVRRSRPPRRASATRATSAQDGQASTQPASATARPIPPAAASAGHAGSSGQRRNPTSAASARTAAMAAPLAAQVRAWSRRSRERTRPSRARTGFTALPPSRQAHPGRRTPARGARADATASAPGGSGPGGWRPRR